MVKGKPYIMKMYNILKGQRTLLERYVVKAIVECLEKKFGLSLLPGLL